MSKVPDGRLLMRNVASGCFCFYNDDPTFGPGHIYCPYSSECPSVSEMQKALNSHRKEHEFVDRHLFSVTPAVAQEPGVLTLRGGSEGDRSCVSHAHYSPFHYQSHADFECTYGATDSRVKLESKQGQYRILTLDGDALGVSPTGSKAHMATFQTPKTHMASRTAHDEEHTYFELFYVRNCNDEVTLKTYKGLGHVENCDA